MSRVQHPKRGGVPRSLFLRISEGVPWSVFLFVQYASGRLTVRVRSRKCPMFMRPRTTGRLHTTKSHLHLARIFWSLDFGICLGTVVWCLGFPLGRSRGLVVLLSSTPQDARQYGSDLENAHCLCSPGRQDGSTPPRATPT